MSWQSLVETLTFATKQQQQKQEQQNQPSSSLQATTTTTTTTPKGLSFPDVGSLKESVYNSCAGFYQSIDPNASTSPLSHPAAASPFSSSASPSTMLTNSAAFFCVGVGCGVALHLKWPLMVERYTLWTLSRLPHATAGGCYPKMGRLERWRINFYSYFGIYTNTVEIAKRHEVNRVLKRTGFAVGYNDYARGPLWVSYLLTPAAISLAQAYSSQCTASALSGSSSDPTSFSFTMDRSLPAHCRPQVSDFHGTGYDKGHLAPKASVGFSFKATKDSFLLSNVMLQDPSLNRGLWRELESLTRFWASIHCKGPHTTQSKAYFQRVTPVPMYPSMKLLSRGRRWLGSRWVGSHKKSDALAICVGPVFSRHTSHTKVINGIRVPDMVFMAVQDLHSSRSVGWLLPNHITKDQARRLEIPTTEKEKEKGGSDATSPFSARATMLRYKYLQAEMLSINELEDRVREYSGCESFGLFRQLPRGSAVPTDSPFRATVDKDFWLVPVVDAAGSPANSSGSGSKGKSHNHSAGKGHDHHHHRSSASHLRHGPWLHHPYHHQRRKLHVSPATRFFLREVDRCNRRDSKHLEKGFCQALTCKVVQLATATTTEKSTALHQPQSLAAQPRRTPRAHPAATQSYLRPSIFRNPFRSPAAAFTATTTSNVLLTTKRYPKVGHGSKKRRFSVSTAAKRKAPA